MFPCHFASKVEHVVAASTRLRVSIIMVGRAGWNMRSWESSVNSNFQVSFESLFLFDSDLLLTTLGQSRRSKFCSLLFSFAFAFLPKEPTYAKRSPQLVISKRRRLSKSQGVGLTITSVQCKRARRTQAEEFMRRDDVRDSAVDNLN